jgi:hypothetical protein
MPWWSWLIIWAFLAIGFLAMLALFALEKLAMLTEVLGTAGTILDDQRADIAVLLGLAEVRRRRARVRNASTARRAARRDTRIIRAKSLIAVDASKRSWFVTTNHSKAR